MSTIDRYILRMMALRSLAVVAIVVAILSLENISRLAADVEKTVSPIRLLSWLSLLLVPEQLSAAVPVALFLGVALGTRQMAMRGEWAMLPAARMNRWRIMAAPMLLGLAAASLQLVDRLELQPAGLRGLDALYLAMQAGSHGVPVSLDEPIALDAHTTLLAAPARAGRPGDLEKVLIKHDDQLFSAPAASIRALNGGVIALDLFKGYAFSGIGGGAAHSASFHHMRLFGRPTIIGLVGNDARHRLDRQGAAGLLATMRTAPADGDGDAARAALAMRIDSALFCLMLPLLGTVLGMVPQRGATAFGLGWGILLVVAHLKSAAFVEDSFPAYALSVALLHLGAWGVVVVTAVVAEARLGAGWAEVASQATLRRLLAIGRRWADALSLTPAWRTRAAA